MQPFMIALLLVLGVMSSLGSSIAAEVRIAVGRSQPPYFIVDQKNGVQHDIIKEAFAYRGHEFTAFYVSTPRAIDMLNRRQIAGSATVLPGMGFDDLLTDEVVAYQNVIISKKEDKLKIESLRDLRGLSVVAFQSAKNRLGTEYAETVASAKNYFEVTDQMAQVRMLNDNRKDVAVADRNIFGFYLDKALEEGKILQKYECEIHAVFPPTIYHLAIWDDALRADFNEGLAYLRESGRYAEIYAEYGVSMEIDRTYSGN